MALTATLVAGTDRIVGAGVKVAVAEVTATGTYTTGGVTCDFSAICRQKVYAAPVATDADGWKVGLEPAALNASATPKIVFRYTTSVLDKAVMPEADSGTSISGVTFRMFLIGL